MFAFGARILTAAGLYVLARWIFGIGSPVADAQMLRRWLYALLDLRPKLERLVYRLWLAVHELVGLTDYQLHHLRTAIENGHYSDDRC